MKKTGLVILLVLCLVFPPFARAESGASAIFRQGEGTVSGYSNFNGEAIVGDMVYSLDYNFSYIYQYSLSDGTTQKVSALVPLESEGDMKRARVPAVIVGDGESVYAVEATLFYGESENRIEDLGFYRLAIGDTVSDEKICELDFGDKVMSLDTADFFEAIVNVAYTGGMLFVAIEASERIGMAIDTSDGTTTTLDLPGIREFAVLDESHVLAACHPDDATETALYFVDPSTLEFKRKCAIPDDSGRARGFAYYEKALYFMRNGSVWELTSLDGESATVVANSPVTASRAVVGENGVYVTGDECQVMLRDLTQEEEPVELTYGGDCFPSALVDDYLAAHPNVTLGDAKQYMSNDIITALLTQSAESDVYFLWTTGTLVFQSMRDRGYCAPLESDVIEQAVSEMYPGVADFVTHDGAIVAIPVSVNSQMGMGIDRAVWSALGLAEDNIPVTWVEFLAFLRDTWPGLAAQYPDYALMVDEDNGREFLFYQIMNQYNDKRATAENDPGYDAEEFRATMEAYLSVDFDSLENDTSLPSGHYLFNTYYRVTPEISVESFTHLPLVFTEGDEATGAMSFTMAVINPYSTHKEEALTFIESLVENMDPLDHVALCPGDNQPVESATYESNLQTYNESIQTYEEEIAAETDEAKAEEIRREMEAYQETYGEMLERSRWSASEESIAAYRSSIEDVIPSCAYTLNEADQRERTNLFERFYQGNLDLDTFISELDRMLYMSALEDQ